MIKSAEVHLSWKNYLAFVFRMVARSKAYGMPSHDVESFTAGRVVIWLMGESGNASQSIKHAFATTGPTILDFKEKNQ